MKEGLPENTNGIVIRLIERSSHEELLHWRKGFTRKKLGNEENTKKGMRKNEEEGKRERERVCKRRGGMDG